MPTNLFAVLIYMALVLLAAATAHAITFRLLFVHPKLRKCSPRIFCQLVNRLNSAQRNSESQILLGGFRTQPDVGWIGELAKHQTWPGLSNEIDRCQNRLNPHLSTIHMAATLGPLIGLMGTVAGFLFSDPHSNQAEGLGLAFRSTLFGIGISVPAFLYQCLSAPFQAELEKQINTVESMLSRLGTFQASNPVPVRGPSTNGQPQRNNNSTANGLIIDAHNFQQEQETNELEFQQTQDEVAVLDIVPGDGGRVCNRGSRVEPAYASALRPAAACQTGSGQRQPRTAEKRSHRAGNPNGQPDRIQRPDDSV